MTLGPTVDGPTPLGVCFVFVPHPGARRQCGPAPPHPDTAAHIDGVERPPAGARITVDCDVAAAIADPDGSTHVNHLVEVERNRRGPGQVSNDK